MLSKVEVILFLGKAELILFLGTAEVILLLGFCVGSRVNLGTRYLCVCRFKAAAVFSRPVRVNRRDRGRGLNLLL